MSEDVIQVAQIVKKHMEGVVQLSVNLPVKIKVGSTWGSMQTLNLWYHLQSHQKELDTV